MIVSTIVAGLIAFSNEEYIFLCPVYNILAEVPQKVVEMERACVNVFSDLAYLIILMFLNRTQYSR